MQVVVLADTHAPRRWRVCPPRVAEHLRQADLILHAGDVCTAAVLAELAEYAPVTAVLGNNDGRDVAEWGAATTAEFGLDGLRVAMVHDSGATTGRLTRMRRRFPARTSWCSGTPTSRWTSPRPDCGSSTRGRPPTAGASRTVRSASSGSTMATWSTPRSSR